MVNVISGKNTEQIINYALGDNYINNLMYMTPITYSDRSNNTDFITMNMEERQEFRVLESKSKQHTEDWIYDLCIEECSELTYYMNGNIPYVKLPCGLIYRSFYYDKWEIDYAQYLHKCHHEYNHKLIYGATYYRIIKSIHSNLPPIICGDGCQSNTYDVISIRDNCNIFMTTEGFILLECGLLLIRKQMHDFYIPRNELILAHRKHHEEKHVIEKYNKMPIYCIEYNKEKKLSCIGACVSKSHKVQKNRVIYVEQ